MKNRAKCKKCESVIESFHSTDYVECKCGRISVFGGNAMYCSSLDWEDFVRIDDRGNEVITKVINKEEELAMPDKNLSEMTKEEMIKVLEEMIKQLESFPSHVMSQPITHYDYLSLLVLMLRIIKCK